MKRKKTLPSHPAGQRQSQAESPVLRRFKTLYGKPKTLTDRYDDCREVDIARVLHKPEAELRWDDFNMLYRVGVASATYEEGLYFLPEDKRKPHHVRGFSDTEVFLVIFTFRPLFLA